MGKVLLIEPEKILQQAIALSLFPDHEVKIAKEIASQAASFGEYDLLIVDAAALRERHGLTQEALRAIQGCTTPTLWLEEEAGAQTFKRDNLVVLQKPVEKEPFQSALTALLSPGGERQERAAVSPRTRAGAVQEEGKKGRQRIPEQGTLQLIDLVDVVDEERAPKQGKRAPRKSK